MNNIFKKIVAIGLVSVMAASFTACSDKKKGKDKITTDSLTSSELESVMKTPFSIKKYEDSSASQDPVESGDSSSADSNSSAGGNDSSAVDNNNSSGDDSNNSQVDNNNNNSNSNNDNSSNNDSKNDNISTPNPTDIISDPNVVIVPGTDKNDHHEGDPVAGNKEVMEVYWMDISKRRDIVFEGEYVKATFKIKDNAPNGTYPLTVEWMDFANFDAGDVKPTPIEGSVTVGGSAVETKFNNSSDFQLKIDGVSGNPGDEVTVLINAKNNPGFVACLFRFGYNSDVLEYVRGGVGRDFGLAQGLSEEEMEEIEY